MNQEKPDFLLIKWFEKFLPRTEIDRVKATFEEKPYRVTRAYQELFESCSIEDASHIISVTKDVPNKNYDGLVSGLDINYLSFCEHHFLPFFGTVDIVYEPGDRIIGIGKLSRLVDYRTKRFNIQEYIAKEICEDLMTFGKAKGCFCRVSAKHSCLCYRGPKKYTSSNVVTYRTGTCDSPNKLSEIQMILSKK